MNFTIYLACKVKPFGFVRCKKIEVDGTRVSTTDISEKDVPPNTVDLAPVLRNVLNDFERDYWYGEDESLGQLPLLTLL